MTSLMRREIREIPAAVDRLLSAGATDISGAVRALDDLDPRVFVSVARGSSDHAATYFKYASELLTGIPVASVGPSVASIYGRRLRLGHAACLAISQSGQSPDIVRMVDMASEEGAVCLALTNNPDSPLARASDRILNLHAGAENSVAATKTFVASATAAVWLLAAWQRDDRLLQAIYELPSVLERAVELDWSPLAREITSDRSLYCLGRGPAYAISNEAALKFKETCQLHAESYSSAEVLHGPVSIVDRGFPVLALASADEAEPAVVEIADALAAKGARVFVTSDMSDHATPLPVARAAHPLLDPISLIASFYGMVETIAQARGIDPDQPRHLQKVTETL